MDDVNKMLELLSTAPDGQLDAKITTKLKELIGKPIEEQKTGVRWAMDMCVHGGLSSGFALKALGILYEIHLGGNMQDFADDNKNPWRMPYPKQDDSK
jgi:hypothetical protein